MTWLAGTDAEADLEARVEGLLSKSAAVTRALKRTLHEGRRKRFEDDLARTERAYLDELLATVDMDEGLAAFFAFVLYQHWKAKPTRYLLWWMIGVALSSPTTT